MSAPLAYFITFRAYGTWLHGDPRGAVDPLHHVYQTPRMEPHDGQRQAELARMKCPPVRFDKAQREVVNRSIRDVCDYRRWHIYALEVRSNHVHVVVAAPLPPERVMNDLKAWSTRRLVEAGLRPPGAKAWGRHGSTVYLFTEQELQAAIVYVRDFQDGPHGQ